MDLVLEAGWAEPGWGSKGTTQRAVWDQCAQWTGWLLWMLALASVSMLVWELVPVLAMVQKIQGQRAEPQILSKHPVLGVVGPGQVINTGPRVRGISNLVMRHGW